MCQALLSALGLQKGTEQTKLLLPPSLHSKVGGLDHKPINVSSSQKSRERDKGDVKVSGASLKTLIWEACSDVVAFEQRA